MAPGRKTGGRVKGTLNKSTAEVKLVAQQYTIDAIEGLVHIAQNSPQDTARVAAWKEILDRGHGKATHEVKHSGAIGHYDLTRLSLEALEQLEIILSPVALLEDGTGRVIEAEEPEPDLGEM